MAMKRLYAYLVACLLSAPGCCYHSEQYGSMCHIGIGKAGCLNCRPCSAGSCPTELAAKSDATAAKREAGAGTGSEGKTAVGQDKVAERQSVPVSNRKERVGLLNRFLAPWQSQKTTAQIPVEIVPSDQLVLPPTDSSNPPPNGPLYVAPAVQEPAPQRVRGL
jgi:hypothetical protein